MAMDTEAKQTGAANVASDTFGIDAGRDLFFTGMDEAMAIEILQKPLGSLSASDDRYIAVERLKFYASDASALALMDFVERFETYDNDNMKKLPVEEQAARRKAIESLGRHKGMYQLDRVKKFMENLLVSTNSDTNTLENVTWSLAQLPGDLTPDAVRLLCGFLAKQVADGDSVVVPYRTILHTLTEKQAKEAIDTIRAFVPQDLASKCAQATALAMLAGETELMESIPQLLYDADLNVRRAAMHDLTTAKYAPALEEIASAPLSLVLRIQGVRACLDESDTTIFTENIAQLCDRLIWDHPYDLNLLGRVRDTRRARDAQRNVNALYRNDALDAYVACRTLAEDRLIDSDSTDVRGKLALESYTERAYFDYFGSYHAFKTLGWLQYTPGVETLIKAADELPPRFFNHRIGAITALANFADSTTSEHGSRIKEVLIKAAGDKVWAVRYAALVAAGIVGNGGNSGHDVDMAQEIRSMLADDGDWVVRERARCSKDFQHLRRF